ncbi:helix-turn-helix domain-containing protein [Micromonospora haikouensis]|uniref:helix-turn-helix domain-containing protein n=1 Tax=Micromonospora haikouensis TaxID=686309 RepID=UPI0037956145
MKPLLDKNGLAELLNVEVTWVEKATAARTIPITWVGRYARYDLDDIAAWLDSCKEQPEAVPALGIVGSKKPNTPAPSKPPRAPKPPAGPIKPKPPAGPRRADGKAA